MGINGVDAIAVALTENLAREWSKDLNKPIKYQTLLKKILAILNSEKFDDPDWFTDPPENPDDFSVTPADWKKVMSFIKTEKKKSGVADDWAEFSRLMGGVEDPMWEKIWRRYYNASPGRVYRDRNKALATPKGRTPADRSPIQMLEDEELEEVLEENELKEDEIDVVDEVMDPNEINNEEVVDEIETINLNEIDEEEEEEDEIEPMDEWFVRDPDEDKDWLKMPEPILDEEEASKKLEYADNNPLIVIDDEKAAENLEDVPNEPEEPMDISSMDDVDKAVNRPRINVDENEVEIESPELLKSAIRFEDVTPYYMAVFSKLRPESMGTLIAIGDETDKSKTLFEFRQSQGGQVTQLDLDHAKRNPLTTSEVEGYAAQFLNRRASAIEMMMNSGADFQQNAFDCYLMCTPKFTPEQIKRGEISDNEPMVDFFDEFYKNNVVFGRDMSQMKMMGDGAAFAVRVKSIGVPQPVSDTFEVPFLFDKVKKVRSKVNFERKAEISLRMDEPLYFATFINLISNNNNLSLEFGLRPSLFTPFTTTNTFVDKLHNKAIRVDMYVAHVSLMRSAWKERAQSYPGGREDTFGAANRVKTLSGLEAQELPMWCFEDVNFIGMTSEVVFKRDSADTMDGAFPFVFRRLYKIDFQLKEPGLHTWRYAAKPLGLPTTQARLNDQRYWYDNF